MNAEEIFHPKIKGGATGADECAKKCRRVALYFTDFATTFKGKVWAYPATFRSDNCQSFQGKGMKKCNLGKFCKTPPVILRLTRK
ncbi:MAG: hypothetical protein LBE22_12295 [Azoarcus sp.]|nr:hypothetical protein [Azoarcus sp.]